MTLNDRGWICQLSSKNKNIIKRIFKSCMNLLGTFGNAKINSENKMS